MRVCSICGSKDRVAIHHKNRNHYDNDKKNLDLLCNSCHSKEHIIDSGAGKQEKSFTLVDWFSKRNYGFRLIKGFNMLRD